MKKRDRIKQKDNVIFFPELEKRLTEKGLECLQMKNFKEAIRLLEEAKELDPENGEILIGLVIAYFEAGRLEEAKILSKEMLHHGIGDYLQMVDLYLTILIQLHEYDEIVATIEALLDEKEIPPEKYDHFLTILQFTKRMAGSRQNENKSEMEEGIPLENESPLELNLFSLQDPKEQLLLVSKLANQNIRPYIHDIKAYLNAESGHPFLKTMLLNILKEQEYDREVLVKKLGIEDSFIPAELPEVYAQERMKDIINHLSTRLENNDPILFENTKSLVERYFFIAYPFLLDPNKAEVWAAAFHLTALEYHGMEEDTSGVPALYGVTEEEMRVAGARIKEFEEISYPII